MAQKLQVNPTPLKPTLRETARVWRRLLYSKIENIFVYENLPKEIPIRLFNLMLFKTGKVVFYKIGDKFTVQPFSYNDILNWYYVPLKGRVVNPYLPVGHQNWEFKIEDECIIYNSSPDILNYRQNSVTSDLVFKTANQLAENDISYYCIQRNSRLIALFTAETDLQKREMDKIINKMYEGETDITMLEDIVSHVHANPLTQNSTRNSITELIEFQQYVLANFYHSFGINSNYNLKREQLNSDEINVNQEVLRLNIEDMLKCREDGVEKINEKFGLNITVSLNEKLYATLLQQANLFQSGTVDPETGLQETQYVDTDNVSQNASQNNSQNTEKIKKFLNSIYGAPNLESEDNNDNTKNNPGETTSEKDNKDNNTGNEREPGSDDGDKREPESDDRRKSGGMDDRGNSETENSGRRNSQSDETHQQHETSGESGTDDNKNGPEQISDDENDAERGMAQQTEQIHEQSSEVDTKSDDTADGIHSGDDNTSDTVINIIINNAENVDVKTDEEPSQNGTESEDE